MTTVAMIAASGKAMCRKAIRLAARLIIESLLIAELQLVLALQ